MKIGAARKKLVNLVESFKADPISQGKYKAALELFDADDRHRDRDSDGGEDVLIYVAHEMISCGNTIKSLANP